MFRDALSWWSSLRRRVMWPSADAVERLRTETATTNLLLSALYHQAALLTSHRYADERHLARFGYRVFSQSDEDGFVEAIFERIGAGSRFFVEFGAGSGVENNTRYLLLKGWRGVWIEAEPELVSAVRRRFAAEALRAIEARVTAENVEALFEEAGVPEEFDLLSIDVDGNDYWVWRSIARFRPRVVVVEYNATFGPLVDHVVPYDPAHRWDRTSHFGASLKALERLAESKGYALVGCNFTGANAFFVRQDLVGDRFTGPFTARQHWEPPRYFVSFFGGQPPG